MVRRGDVPFDLARSDDMRQLVLPDMVSEIKGIAVSKGIDPRFGNTFQTAKGHRQVSPLKERALGRISPTKDDRAESLSPPKERERSKSPSKGGQLKVFDEDT